MEHKFKKGDKFFDTVTGRPYFYEIVEVFTVSYKIRYIFTKYKGSDVFNTISSSFIHSRAKKINNTQLVKVLYG